MKRVSFILFLMITGNAVGVLTDDPNTIGLWHMDYTAGGMILDDDSTNPGRDQDLTLGYGNLAAPFVTSGGGGYFDEALSFDGTAIARNADFWNHDLFGVTVECWVMISAMPTAEAIEKYLIECPDNFRLYLHADGKLYWDIKDPATAGRISMTVSDKLNQWLHIIASYEEDTEQLMLSVNDQTVSDAAWRPMVSIPSILEIGHRYGKPISRGFEGFLDELKISSTQQVLPDPNTNQVILIDNGSSVTLSNGIVTGIIQKSNAKMSAMYKGNSPNLLGTYWYWDCNADGLYQQINNSVYTLVSQSAEQVEVAFKQNGMINGNLDYDVHYILRQGESGFYAFAVMSSALQQAWYLEQARCVVRNSPDIFYYMIVDDNRQKVPPTPQELADARANGGILSPSEATLLPDGSIDDKYLFSEYWGEHFVHGWAGAGYGMWMIMPSPEFQNGGPTTQELTVHQTTTTPVILDTFQGAHYGSGVNNFAEQESWEKMYGPFFVYINEGPTEADQWNDAKAKAEMEKGRWPYQWMNHPLYPTERGSVRGILNITDGTSPENAWIILSEPETTGVIPNWQQQGKGYQFYARADAEGHFEIQNVREGSYSLYAFTEGVPEEYRMDGIQVYTNQQTNMGTIDWQPEMFGRTVWQVGKFDRTAGEYKHGDKFHDGSSWGMWLDYPVDFPNDVHFTIGSSNERDDWNYTQMAYEKEDETFHLPVWTIYFNLDQIPPGQAMLTVGIAASRLAALEIRVNGVQIEYDTAIEAGSACVRNSIQGTYQLKRLSFDTSLLQPGPNTITLKQFHGRTFANIMYDAIRLQMPWWADFDGNGWVDLVDLAEFSSQWLTVGTTANFNGDALIDLQDFSILANEWK